MNVWLWNQFMVKIWPKYQLDVKLCVLLKIDLWNQSVSEQIKYFILILWIISKYCYRIEYIGKMSGRYLNDKNSFCYTCGESAFKENRKTIDEFYMKACFKIKLGDQDKTCVPHIICKSCRESLRLWKTGNRTALKFGIPMIGREPANHFDDCYFCMTNLAGYNKKNRKNILYPSIPSATRPIPHSDENHFLFLKSYLVFLFQLHLLRQSLYQKSWLKTI